MVARQPACGGQGHHALPLRDLAGHVDECRRRIAQAGVRPRLGVFQGRAHEQDDGEHRRSAGCGVALRSRSAAALPRERNPLRRRRRLHLGALRGKVQRRPRQQPRQPGEPHRVDDRALPAGRHPFGRRRPAGGHCRRDGRVVPGLDGCSRAARGCRGRVPADQRGEQLHCRNPAMVPREGPGKRGPLERRARGYGRSRPHRRRPALAGDAGVGYRDHPPPGRCRAGVGAAIGQRHRLAHVRRETDSERGRPVASH